MKQHLKASPVSTVLTHTYVAGEKVYVDFAGQPMEYIDRDTAEVIKVQTFVACLPYTDYAFALCVPSQKSEDVTIFIFFVVIILVFRYLRFYFRRN